MRFLTVAAAILFCATSAIATPAAIRLKLEHTSDVLGIGTTHPRFSWQLSSQKREAAQTAYRIRVATSVQALRTGSDLLWDTGRLESAESNLQPYAGPSLSSRQRYFWQVQVWDERGRDLGWSEIGWWEMGLLKPTDWHASWISPAAPGESHRPAVLRKDFRLSGRIRQARAYVTSRGTV